MHISVSLQVYFQVAFAKLLLLVEVRSTNAIYDFSSTIIFRVLGEQCQCSAVYRFEIVWTRAQSLVFGCIFSLIPTSAQPQSRLAIAGITASLPGSSLQARLGDCHKN